ncbi:26S proteasome regulatory subunit 6B [Clydaea vesicula]|uniref:26S proteasome regulatory subunit 6B n=1 Tax=Clydaea vesicula TaxID=447962 RepID=A0AAD5U3E3_9FUNG|nr:26S proteasome regulatory subunit 6B [Clydaea vesicula]
MGQLQISKKILTDKEHVNMEKFKNEHKVKSKEQIIEDNFFSGITNQGKDVNKKEEIFLDYCQRVVTETLDYTLSLEENSSESESNNIGEMMLFDNTPLEASVEGTSKYSEGNKMNCIIHSLKLELGREHNIKNKKHFRNLKFTSNFESKNKIYHEQLCAEPGNGMIRSADLPVSCNPSCHNNNLNLNNPVEAVSMLENSVKNLTLKEHVTGKNVESNSKDHPILEESVEKRLEVISNNLTSFEKRIKQVEKFYKQDTIPSSVEEENENDAKLNLVKIPSNVESKSSPEPENSFRLNCQHSLESDGQKTLVYRSGEFVSYVTSFISNAVFDVLPPDADSPISMSADSEWPEHKIREAAGVPLTHFDFYKQMVLIHPEVLYCTVHQLGIVTTMLLKALLGGEEQNYTGYLGEGPRMTARENSPLIIYIEEIDAIAAKRLDAQTGANRQVQRILVDQMDGFVIFESCFIKTGS